MAAFAYGLAGVYGRRFRLMKVDPLFTATGQLTASSVVMVPLVMMQEGLPDLTAVDQGILWSILGLAALSTALAYLIYFQILSTAGATNLLLVTFLIPVSAILLGYLFLGERLDPSHYLGMGIIGLSLIAIDGRLLRGPRKLEPGGRDASNRGR